MGRSEGQKTWYRIEDANEVHTWGDRTLTLTLPRNASISRPPRITRHSNLAGRVLEVN